MADRIMNCPSMQASETLPGLTVLAATRCAAQRRAQRRTKPTGDNAAFLV